MPAAETAVEKAIYSLGGTLFARIINPLIIVFVAIAIALFLYIVFRRFMDGKIGKADGIKSLLPPLLGLTIMLSAIGITYFIANTGDDFFCGNTGPCGATKGINEVVKSLDIR